MDPQRKRPLEGARPKANGLPTLRREVSPGTAVTLTILVQINPHGLSSMASVFCEFVAQEWEEEAGLGLEP